MEERIRKNNKRRLVKVLLILVCIISIIGVAFLIVVPPTKGKLSSYKDENGKMLKNSLVEKSYVNIDGSDIGTYILSKDVSNPVLLICGGGPGIPQILLEEFYQTSLSDYFTLCYYDYRGTGRSYTSKEKESEMNMERYLKDVYALSENLKERFSKKRIYIMGHSFGSFIALNAIYNKPEYYYAYFAQSQITNQMKSEVLALEYMKEEYLNKGNKKMYNSLAKYDIKNSNEELKKYFFDGIRDKAMHDLGVGTTRKMKSVVSGIFFPSLRTKCLTISERINIWKAKVKSNNYKVEDEVLSFDSFTSISRIEIPVYFFVGEYDYTCCASLQKEYYEFIDAPSKEMYLYENVAHSPIYEDKEKTNEIFSKMNLINE